jgi:hypothetical protein
MKRIFFSFLFVLLVSPAFSQLMDLQNDVLINRLDKQSDSRWQHTVTATPISTIYSSEMESPVLLDKDRVLPTAAGGTTSFSLTITDPRVNFTSGSTGNIKGHIVNNTDMPLQLVFRRWQTLPPDEWNSSVCFGDLCYIYFVDSLPWGDNYPYYELPAKGEAEFKLAVFAPAGADDSMHAYIRISALNTAQEDTAGFFVAAKAEPQSDVGLTDSKPNFKILSVFPTPLVNSGTIKVSVMSPANTGYSYTIFDNLGREVAYGSTRQQLSFGSNTISIRELDGLPTGSYLFRMKAAGSADAIPFQVIK